MRKYILRIVAFSLLLFVVNKTCAYDFEVEGKYFNVLSPSTCEMTNGNKPYSNDVEIPTTVKYNGRNLTVVAIGDFCFQNATIKSISVGSNIERMGRGVFDGCTSLTKVHINESVTITNSFKMFFNCHHLEEVHLPLHMKDIGNSCFENCYDLQTIDIPKEVTSIGQFAFRRCVLIDNITIPSRCISLGERCFEDCINLYNLKIEDSKEQLKIYPYYLDSKSLGCSLNVKNIYIGRDLSLDITSSCALLEHVILGNYINKVPKGLSYCLKIIDIKITSDKLPEMVTTFNSKVFVNANLFVQKGLGATVSSTNIWNKFWTVNEVDFRNCSNSIHVINVGDGHVSINGFDIYNNPDVPIENGQCTINIKPEPGNEIDKVLLSGQDITSEIRNGKYSTMISDNKILKVYFMKVGSDVPPSAYVEVAGTKWARGNLAYDENHSGDKRFIYNWRFIDNCYDYINCYSGRSSHSFQYNEYRTEHFFLKGSNYNVCYQNDLMKYATNSNYRLPTRSEFNSLANCKFSYYSFIRNKDRLVFGYYFSDETPKRQFCYEGNYYKNAICLNDEDLEKGVFFPLTGLVYPNTNSIVDCGITGIYYTNLSSDVISYLYTKNHKETGSLGRIIYEITLGKDDIYIGPHSNLAFGAYGLRGVVYNYSNTTSSIIDNISYDNSYIIYDINGIEHNNYINGLNIIKYKNGKTSKIFKR